MSDKDCGLYGKYRVERVDGKPVEWAFVLNDTDPYTPFALLAYARACERDYPALASDLTSKAVTLREREEQRRQARRAPDVDAAQDVAARREQDLRS